MMKFIQKISDNIPETIIVIFIIFLMGFLLWNVINEVVPQKEINDAIEQATKTLGGIRE